MSSTLTGLNVALAWSQFTPKRGTPPGPDDTETAAYTDVTVPARGVAFPYVAKSNPEKFQLANTVVVAITFMRGTSWVMDWVLKRSPAEQAALLRHEQGHYNISALIGRDFFIDLMQLKGVSYSTQAEGIKAFKDLADESINKIKTVDDLYDTETESGTKTAVQNQWNGYLQSAFNTARTSGGTSPDEIPYKARLIDLLRGAGKTI